MKSNRLYAPTAYWRARPDELAQICNGCGPSGLMSVLVPDTVFGLSIASACNIHDFMYHLGIDLEDKQEADRVFLNNMIRIVISNTSNKLLLRLRLHFVYKYYAAVDKFGGPFYWKDKNGDAYMNCV